VDEAKVQVKGIKDLQRGLNQLEEKAGPELRKGLNKIAAIVADAARDKVPRRSGKAAQSIKVGSTQRAAQIKTGGTAAPYYPWLDFGGKVGRGKSVRRTFIKEGRYIYPTLREKRGLVTEKVDELIRDLAVKAGFDTDGKVGD
jgi:hypothetical protein